MCSQNDSFDYQVLNLSRQFYKDYPDPPYSEIIRKSSRPYSCLLLQSHYGYFICIPFRSHINHKHAYKFKHSLRSKRTNSGLDYSKIIILKSTTYLSRTDAIVDKDEYNETRNNINHIKNDAQDYIDNYVGYYLNPNNYDKKSFCRTYQYSTLQYFHKELGISTT